jgi:hypothetical protein
MGSFHSLKFGQRSKAALKPQKPPHSRQFARLEGLWHSRQRLECGAFTAAFVRTTCVRIPSALRPHKSGAEVTALQTPARWLGVGNLAKRPERYALLLHWSSDTTND